jgi:peptidoglycan pentaglycine glycine transferase (the first glycine)
MEIREINSKEEWEDFLEQCPEKTFLQSWNWGEFQKKEGNKIWRFGAYSGDEIAGVCLVVKIIAKRGTFLFIPHGPIIKSDKSAFPVFFKKIKEIAITEKADFIRVSPIFERTKENLGIFKEFGFRQAPVHMHPEVTWELDISLSEDDLLPKMRKTTRYLIRQAQRENDINIIKSDKKEDLKIFEEIYNKTAERRNFVAFSEKYVESEFSVFSPDNQILLFLGKYKGETAVAAMFVFWQGGAFYHHSGSLEKYSKIPISYLLQWQAIEEAKRRGCFLYNFWGIAEQDSKFKKHPWAGLSLFKMGFGGYKKEYVKTQDLPLTFRYWPIFIFETLRKMKRRL